MTVNSDSKERISICWLQECTLLNIESQFDLLHDTLDFLKFVISGSTCFETAATDTARQRAMSKDCSKVKTSALLSTKKSVQNFFNFERLKQ